MPLYAIGDIHGHLDLLRGLHGLIAEDAARQGTPARIVHVGDLVDRGPNSAGVIDYLMTGIAQGRDWIVLKGNHDRMLGLFLDDPQARDAGLRSDLSYLHYKIGGGATLASYGVRNAADRPIKPVHAEAVANVPAAHRAFLTGLPTSYVQDQALFVHAGIRPGLALADQSETDLLWIRSGFLDDPRDHGLLVVHGHTALDAPRHYGNRVNIDSGAAYGGPLSAIVIEDRSIHHLTLDGRVPLLPGGEV
jgi:serine/threonine protein phosphatase 1